MNFNAGDSFSVDGEQIVIKSLLGDGGQGEVYLADYKGKDYAFKYYKDWVDEDFRYNLKNNIARGAPSEDFLWPKKLYDFDDGKIGYLMDLRPKNFVSFVSYLNGTAGFRNRRTMLDWCIELCESYKALHEKGLSYQDLNDGSFFFDPNTGALLICDNDNVAPHGKNLGILGKMRYMAPEIVRGEARPDTHTDRFSLAVILFLTLCLGNPFEGERLKEFDIYDEEASLDLFGKNPIFVYHKTDKSNRPIRGYHGAVLRRWPTLPIYIKEAFHRTFVDGLTDRENGRTTEVEWLKVLTKYRDELLTCNSCGEQYIYGFEEKATRDVCPKCQAAKKDFCALYIEKNHIILEPGARIFATHLDKYSSEYNKPVAEVIAGKKDPTHYGIRLSAGMSAKITDESGNEKEIADGGVIPVVRNLKITFNNNIEGEIR